MTHHPSLPSSIRHLIILLMLIIPAVSGNAAVEEGDGESDFYLNITALDYFTRASCSGEFSKGKLGQRVLTYGPGDYFNIGVNTYISTYANKEQLYPGNDDLYNTDFGFSNNSVFFIGSYTGTPKYIESIEFTCSGDNSFGGAGLNVYARNKDKQPYTKQTYVYEYAEDYDFYKVIYPHLGNAENTKIVFPAPVSYIAFTMYDEAKVSLARFESFRIHFVDEWKDPAVSDDKPGVVSVTLIPGLEGEIYDGLNFDRGGMYIDNALSLPEKKDGTLYTAEELGLTFHVTPLIEEFTRKPDCEGDKPSVMRDEEWEIFKLLEAHEVAYDGYLDSLEPIECELNPNTGQLSIPVPCSGLYTLEVSSSLEGVQIDCEPVVLNIWPDITAAYPMLADWGMEEYLHRFSMNSININEESGKMLYPYAEDNTSPYAHEEIVILTPGIYDAEIFYKKSLPASSGQDDLTGRRLTDSDDGLAGYTSVNEKPLDFTDVTSSADIELKLKKNGAVTPAVDGKSITNISVQLSAGVSRPTGINIITNTPAPECGGEEYFDLNGLKVSPENMIPGIYIRKTQNKVEKILVNR